MSAKCPTCGQPVAVDDCNGYDCDTRCPACGCCEHHWAEKCPCDALGCGCWEATHMEANS